MVEPRLHHKSESSIIGYADSCFAYVSAETHTFPPPPLPLFFLVSVALLLERAGLLEKSSFIADLSAGGVAPYLVSSSDETIGVCY